MWIGDCSLKVQFWDLFCICNQTDNTVAQVWDGNELKLTFRRCVNHLGMKRWDQLVCMVKQHPPVDETDTPIWGLEPNGLFSVKSFDKQINFGGVVSDISPNMWKILCP